MFSITLAALLIGCVPTPGSALPAGLHNLTSAKYMVGTALNGTITARVLIYSPGSPYRHKPYRAQSPAAGDMEANVRITNCTTISRCSDQSFAVLFKNSTKAAADAAAATWGKDNKAMASSAFSTRGLGSLGFLGLALAAFGVLPTGTLPLRWRVAAVLLLGVSGAVAASAVPASAVGTWEIVTAVSPWTSVTSVGSTTAYLTIKGDGSFTLTVGSWLGKTTGLGKFEGDAGSLSAGSLVPDYLQLAKGLKLDGSGEEFNATGTSILGEAVTAIYPRNDSLPADIWVSDNPSFCYQTLAGVKTLSYSKPRAGTPCKVTPVIDIWNGCGPSSAPRKYSPGPLTGNCNNGLLASRAATRQGLGLPAALLLGAALARGAAPTRGV